MSVTTVEKDLDNLTITVTVAELDASVERAWELWADPGQFQRWWGHPDYPVTIVDHDLRTGGRVAFTMGAHDADHMESTWEVLSADPPHRLEMRDAVVDDDGTPSDGGPTGMVITIAEGDAGRAVMAILTTFASLEGLEQTVEMGWEEGMQMVLRQIDEVLAGTSA